MNFKGLDRSTSLISIGSRNRVDTSNSGGEYIILSLTTAPSVGVFSLRINRSSGDGSLITVTNDEVAREGELRSSVHNDRLVSSDSFGRSTNKTLGFSSKGVGTSLIQSEGDLREILTFNSHTVHIPSVEVIDNFTIIGGSSGQDNLFTSADNRIFNFRRSNCDFDVSQLLVNHVNRDSVNNFTILVSSSSSGHIVGRGSIRLNGKRRTHIIINRPLVSNNLRVETIEISIQHNSSAGAHILSGSGDLEVSTQLIDGELSGSRTFRIILFRRNREGIDTGLIRVDSKSTACSRTSPSVRISSTFRKCSFSRSDSSRNFISSTITNHVVTRNRNFRSTENCNICGRNLGKVNIEGHNTRLFTFLTLFIKVSIVISS